MIPPCSLIATFANCDKTFEAVVGSTVVKRQLFERVSLSVAYGLKAEDKRPHFTEEKLSFVASTFFFRDSK